MSIDAQMEKPCSSGNGGNTLGSAESWMSFAILRSLAAWSRICCRTKDDMTKPTRRATKTSARPFNVAVAPTSTSRCTAAELLGIITYVGKLSTSLCFQ